ncbi:CBS domain-containing protein [Cupriavidus basilensis]|uniref:CBS domain-containing protein n=1 Tax=Cupriavidus basilensis TaxID=68895 RepID=UPI00157BB26E|nr:CBS domain-containing protein [Cupriavidus basilensis]NUA30547.1 CBS domain-containing protein [Cupriavidus basilensis]
MSNSQSFLRTFSDIERWLRQQLQADRSVTFYQLVERVAEKNTSVRRYKEDLKEFADLRNAIVHERSDEHVIAEPNDRAVHDFDRVRELLLKPPTIYPQFQKVVKSREQRDPISDAIEDMREGSFSQLPITFDGRFVALLTTETVVRWLASEVSEDLVSLQSTSIEKVLPHVEDDNHYCFLSKRATLDDALSKFAGFNARGKHLDAILITEDGKIEQKLLGILTVYDLPEVHKTLGVGRK